jgi:hypothetical protein
MTPKMSHCQKKMAATMTSVCSAGLSYTFRANASNHESIPQPTASHGYRKQISRGLLHGGSRV